MMLSQIMQDAGVIVLCYRRRRIGESGFSAKAAARERIEQLPRVLPNKEKT